MAEEAAAEGADMRRRRSPVVVIAVGMAGAGKTSLLHRLALHAQEQQEAGQAQAQAQEEGRRQCRTYFVCLDPAMLGEAPYGAAVDIRDTVDYKAVMKEYKLGPNGAIMTALNIFCTRFDQVVSIIENRADELDYVFVDTPGQIEMFTWSASGQIIAETLASTFPTIIAYVVDTPRTTSPTTFMSNMLYACSMLYKSKLPIVCTFNKVDVVSHSLAKDWMDDFEKFQEALDSSTQESYVDDLNRSLNLALSSFYRTLRTVGVSAATGEGVADFFLAIDGATQEFHDVFLPDMRRRQQEVAQRLAQRQAADSTAVAQDIAHERGSEPPETGSESTATATATAATASEEHEGDGGGDG